MPPEGAGHVGQALLYLILIIAAAKLGGEIAEYLRQPAVLGELLVGILLAATPLRAAAGDRAIVFIGAIGIILLLFEVGLDSELVEFLRVGKSAVLVATIGIGLPMAAGYAAVALLGGDYRQALFVGATLTATSVGITTRVLSDLAKTDSSEARIILGAAVIDDILGLLILSVVLQIIQAGRLDLIASGRAVLVSVVFLVAAIWIGTRFAPPLIRLAQRFKTRGVLVSIAFLFCISLAYAAEEIGLAEIIGAFAAGLVLATTDDRVRIQQQIKPLADIFVPVFFVLVGLQVSLGDLNPLDPSQRGVIMMGLVLLALAILGKLASGLGVVLSGTGRLAVGIGMVPRGEVGLIFASIGLSNGIVGSDLYGVLVIIVFVTTLITPAWLRRSLARSRA